MRTGGSIKNTDSQLTSIGTWEEVVVMKSTHILLKKPLTLALPSLNMRVAPPRSASFLASSWIGLGSGQGRQLLRGIGKSLMVGESRQASCWVTTVHPKSNLKKIMRPRFKDLLVPQVANFREERERSMLFSILSLLPDREIGAGASNKSLQVTFDPPPIFAAAKTAVASNAPEPRR